VEADPVLAIFRLVTARGSVWMGVRAAGALYRADCADHRPAPCVPDRRVSDAGPERRRFRPVPCDWA